MILKQSTRLNTLHESFSFDSTSSSSDFFKRLDLPPSSSLAFYSNDKVNVNQKDHSINDSISEKSIDMTKTFSINETILSSSSNQELNISNLKSKSLLVTESSSFKKYHETKSSQKRTKEEKNSETHPSSEKFETSASINIRKYERTEKIYSASLVSSTIIAHALA